jgi:uncharacterized membrane protein
MSVGHFLRSMLLFVATLIVVELACNCLTFASVALFFSSGMPSEEDATLAAGYILMGLIPLVFSVAIVLAMVVTALILRR